MSAQARDYPHTDSHRPTRNNRVSRRNPCDWCGGSKYCLRFDNGDSACHTVGEADQWTDAFMGVYLHRSSDPAAPARPLRAEHPAAEIANADTLHEVNTDLLALCPLCDEHRALLKNPTHGLDDWQVSLYGTLPVDPTARRAIIEPLIDKYGTGTLLRVPGFFEDEGRIALVPFAGVIVPCRDLQGRITAFQVRSDKPNADPRYLSLSSTSFGGPGPGSPPHLAQPRDLRDPHTVVTVEGIKKADMIAERMGCFAISINGVGAWRAAEDALDALAARGVDTCIIALDRDVKPTAIENVERSRQRLAAAAVARGYGARIASWDKDVAKGPDDLLVAGHTFTIERYCPSSESSESMDGSVDEGAGVAPNVAVTLRIQREALQRAYAKIDTLTRAITMLVRLILTEQYSESEKKVLVWFLHEKLGYTFGLPIPETFEMVRIKDEEKPRAGLSEGSFNTARKRFVADGVLIAEKRPALEGSPTGRPFDVFTVNGERLEHLIVGLDTNTADGAQAEERIARAAQRADEARARYAKMLEERARREQEKARREEQDRITRQQLASIGHERRHFAETTERLSHQLTEKEAEAEAMRHAAVAAQREAQRIIEQARQEQESIACRGCGELIAIKDWRCDDCRTEGTSADRFTGPEFSLSFVGNGYDDGQHRPAPVPPHLPSTTLIPTKLRENPPQAMGEDLKPCAGGCGTLTHRGWECKPCRERPPRPLHISTSAAPGQEASHGH